MSRQCAKTRPSALPIAQHYRLHRIVRQRIGGGPRRGLVVPARPDGHQRGVLDVVKALKLLGDDDRVLRQVAKHRNQLGDSHSPVPPVARGQRNRSALVTTPAHAFTQAPFQPICQMEPCATNETTGRDISRETDGREFQRSGWGTGMAAAMMRRRLDESKFAGADLAACAVEMGWREDRGRISNGEQSPEVTGAALGQRAVA